MELPAVGEHVFAVESIEKKRIRKVRGAAAGGGGGRGAPGVAVPADAVSLPPAPLRAESSTW